MTKPEIIQLRATTTEKEQLLAEAEKKGVSASALLREKLGWDLTEARAPSRPRPAKATDPVDEIVKSVTSKDSEFQNRVRKLKALYPTRVAERMAKAEMEN